MSEQQSKPAAYPQVGVASTCRDYREYIAMFGLSDDDLRRGAVLDVGGGGSSFTAQLNAMGVEAVVADPLYAAATEEVLGIVRKEIDTSSAKLAANAGAFDWSFYGSPEKHRQLREQSYRAFAEDYAREDARRRYVPASLPRLPFEDGSFSLALCSHFLFLYGADPMFDEAFHLAALKELLRVVRPGGEVRIYPMVTLQWEPYPYLSALLDQIKEIAIAKTSESSLPFTPVRSPVLTLAKKP
ncbi:class I SAM-dependent methyltransferase [Cohnella faecalis]|uniref:Class I SAM-dependent methyltransferase n=1 Tax=Cohnella faecalis TaxID=2315694 RepID=A0A398CLF8_9BACL|nr:class I SAM-dependent methyltransferase [Cohnella faecalis]RIE03062.1 class I SAM-dependent methyltransferase [Cohnella faecalis]